MVDFRKGEVLGTYQGFDITSVDFARTIGTAPDRGTIIVVLDNLPNNIRLNVPGINRANFRVGDIVSDGRATGPVPAVGPPEGKLGGFKESGDLVLEMNSGTKITLHRIYIAPEGMEVLEISDDGKIGLVKITIEDERWMWQTRGHFFGKFNEVVEKNGVKVQIGDKFYLMNPKTLKPSDQLTPYNLFEIFELLAFNLPGDYGFGIQSTKGPIGDEIPLSVDFTGFVKPAEAMEQLADQYGLIIALGYEEETPLVQLFPSGDQAFAGGEGQDIDKVNKKFYRKRLENLRINFKPPRVRILGGRRYKEVICADWSPVVQWPFSSRLGKSFLGHCKGEWIALSQFLVIVGIDNKWARGEVLKFGGAENDAFKNAVFNRTLLPPDLTQEQADGEVRKTLQQHAWKVFQASSSYWNFTPAHPVRSGFARSGKSGTSSAPALSNRSGRQRSGELGIRRVESEKPEGAEKENSSICDNSNGSYVVQGTLFLPPTDGKLRLSEGFIGGRGGKEKDPAQVFPGGIWHNSMSRNLNYYGFQMLDNERLIISFNRPIGVAVMDENAIRNATTRRLEKKWSRKHAEIEQDIALRKHYTVQSLRTSKEFKLSNIEEYLETMKKMREELESQIFTTPQPYRLFKQIARFATGVPGRPGGAAAELAGVISKIDQAAAEKQSLEEFIEETRALEVEYQSALNKAHALFIANRNPELFDISEAYLEDPILVVRWSWEQDTNTIEDFYMFDAVPESKIDDPNTAKKSVPVVIHRPELVEYQGIGGSNKADLDELSAKIIEKAYDEKPDTVEGYNYILNGFHLVQTTGKTSQVAWRASAEGEAETLVATGQFTGQGIFPHRGPQERFTYWQQQLINFGS